MTGGPDRRLRVGALALVAGPRGVLLRRGGDPPAWRAPGGEVRVGEPSPVGLARTIAEQVGVEAVVGRLVGVVEDSAAATIDLVYECTLAAAAYDRDDLWVDPRAVGPVVPAGLGRLLALTPAPPEGRPRR